MEQVRKIAAGPLGAAGVGMFVLLILFVFDSHYSARVIGAGLGSLMFSPASWIGLILAITAGRRWWHILVILLVAAIIHRLFFVRPVDHYGIDQEVAGMGGLVLVGAVIAGAMAAVINAFRQSSTSRY